VFFGLFAIATATFVAAYYVPLYRAHQRLDARYRELGLKSQSSAESEKKARLELEAMTQRRDQLRAESDQREGAKKDENDRLEQARAVLAPKLDKLVKKGSAAQVIDGSALYVALDSALLFVPQKLEVLPAARPLLCDTVKAADAKSIAVHGSLAEGASVPQALAKSYPGPIAISAARAAAIAQVLQTACKVPLGQLKAVGDGEHDALSARLVAFKPSERVELELSFR
jgi:chemotaxis protein MotB